jgi:hypothetical protein
MYVRKYLLGFTLLILPNIDTFGVPTCGYGHFIYSVPSTILGFTPIPGLVGRLYNNDWIGSPNDCRFHTRDGRSKG